MRKEDAKTGVRVCLLTECYGISAGATGVILQNDGAARRPLQVDVDGSYGIIWVDLHEVEALKGLRKEGVKEGMKVLVKAGTYQPNSHMRAMVGQVVEVRRDADTDGQVSLYTPSKDDWWWFNVSDIEPVEASQVPSVTINGTVYVPEDTIKAPELAPAPKFFWGQWVKVTGNDIPAMVVQPREDSDGDIKVLFLGDVTAACRAASRCTPIGA